MKRYGIMAIVLCTSILACNVPAFGGVVGKVGKEAVEAILEKAFKRSGREMTESGGKRLAGETLEALVKTHGDDALKVVDDAGLELLEATRKYGDDCFTIALKASPRARRAFAMNAQELLPLVRRVGTEALELEAKSPGLSKRVFKVFGEGAGKTVARRVPAEDVPRLLKYAEKADTHGTKEALVKAYGKEGKSLFERIPAKLVLAAGLTSSMIYGTHRATEPTVALSDAIRESPEVAHTAVHYFTRWGVGAVIFMLCLLLWRFGLMPWHRKRTTGRAPGGMLQNQTNAKTKNFSSFP